MSEGFIPASWREPLRFLLVGLLNTAFGYLAFAALTLVGARPGVALAAAAAASVVFNFQASRRLVFRTRGRRVRFLATYLVLLGGNWGALQVAGMHGLPQLEAQALLCLPIAALSYFCQKTFVFGPREMTAPPTQQS
jgi:putative flippase GtrA